MTQIFLKSTICRLRKFLPATFAHDFVAGTWIMVLPATFAFDSVAGHHSFFNASAGLVRIRRRAWRAMAMRVTPRTVANAPM